uniref:Uncharacterized protein n=1 Tax=Avena sativa TaxID=4498 RepID=A0ACD5ZXW2_AVESA
MVVVKKLVETVDTDEKRFNEEIHYPMKEKHCSDEQGEMVDCVRVIALADVRQRLLFFQYLPKGSIDKKITYAPHRHEWRRRYQIMNGICDGLYYLHRKKNVHFDLEPTNILLDYDVMPKIADFGLSRCFGEKKS